MSTIDGGRPAYPAMRHIAHNSDWDCSETGMTLRDYFAAKAMHAACITDMVPGEACNALLAAAYELNIDPLERIAQSAYEIADAMLKARNA